MMKVGVFGLALGLGLLTSGCGTLDELRDGPKPVPKLPQVQTQQVVPQVPSESPTPPTVTVPRVEQLPPYWYWSDKQQQQADRYLQQQWNFYNQNRQPPPQFPRAPICESTVLGGQVLTTCR
jgi:hypothetical protein